MVDAVGMRELQRQYPDSPFVFATSAAGLSPRTIK
jgi:hypothetical protein